MTKVRNNDGGPVSAKNSKTHRTSERSGVAPLNRAAQLGLAAFAACTAAGFVSQTARAATASWTGLTDNTWAGANWSATPVPGVADTATFNNAGGGFTTIDLGSGVTVNNVIFDSANAAAYTIGNGAVGSQFLTLNNSGGIIVNSTVAHNELFDSAIVLGSNANASTYTFTNNCTTNSLTFAGNIAGGTGGTAGTDTLTIAGTGATYFSGNLNKGGTTNINLLKIGTGTFDVDPTSNVGSASGSITVNAGTLAIDFTNAGANASLLSSFSPVTMAGGTLQIIGNATNASTQTFGGVTVNPGYNVISVSPNGGNLANPLPTLNLAALTQNVGSQTVFYGPAYNTSASGAAAVTVAATGTITTTTLGLQNNLLWPSTRTAVATVGLYNWASVVTTPAGTHNILSGDQVSGFYTQVANGGTAANADTNYDLLGNATFNNAKPAYVDTIRFNVQGAYTATTGAGGSGYLFLIGGILVTPNVGANNSTIANGGEWMGGAYTSAGNCPIDVYQNNTAGELLINVPFYYWSATSRATCFVQGGAGTVNLTGQGTSDGNTGSAYLNGGTTIINQNTQLGGTTSTNVYLNGGTVLGSASALSLGTRPMSLGGNGGGLAAVNGDTMTVGGVIGSVAGTGPLVIGIPASTANGNTAGLVPGTGTGTANSAVNATGIVALTGANYYYGGTTVLGGATLNINGINALGGTNYGGLTLNGGTLQYKSSFSGNGSGDLTSVGTAGVTLAAGGGTIDTNGNTVTFANPIGGKGSGGLTLTDSQAAIARGSLTLSGANSYTGPTTVNAGTLILAPGSSLASSGVTVNTGANLVAMGNSSTGPGLLTLSSGSSLSMVDNTINTLTVGSLTTSASSLLSYEFTGVTNDQIATTVSGGLSINGGTFNLSAGSTSGALPLTTDGTYNLISYVGSDTIAGGNTNAALNADLSVGNPVYGLTYSFHDTGSGTIQLIVSGVAATSSKWITDGSGSWASAVNWTSGGVPNSVGSLATFAGNAATHANLSRTVTLDGNETVGTMFFDSPNGESYTISQGSGGSLILNTGTSATAAITVNAGSQAINAPVALSSNLDINTLGTSILSIGGNVNNATGMNTITKDGTGKLSLSGSNTFGPPAGTVGTIINSGTVQIGNNGAFSTGDVAVTAPVNPVTLQAGANGLAVPNNIIISSGVNLTFDTQANSVVLSGTMSGSGSSITKIGTGLLAISGSGTYTGATIVSAGTLQLGNGGTSGYVSGNIVDNAALVLNRTDDYALGNVISGTGTLTQNGTNNVTLNGSNTFSGNTVIAGGSLITGNALALQNSTLNYNGQGGNLSFGSLSAATIGGLTGSQNLSLTNAGSSPVALSFVGPGTNTYTGTLSGAGSLITGGTGTVTIGSGSAGGATYTGGTTVNSGTLVLGGVTNISDGPIGLTGVGGGVANLIVTDSAQVTSTSILYLEDATLAQGNPAASNLTVKGNSQLTVAGLFIGVTGGTRVASSSVTVQDTATLTVNGDYDLNNTAGSTSSTSPLYLNGGTLAVNDFTFTGTGGNAYAVIHLNGGVLKANESNSAFLPALPRTTVDVDSGGALINTNGNNITIGGALVHGTGTPDGGLTKSGVGTLTLTGANSYTGITNISAGTLNINGINALGGANYAGAIFNGSTLQYANAFTGNGSGDISQNSAATPVAKPVTFGSGGVTVDTNGNNVTFANSVGNNGTGSLTVADSAGTGVLTLAGSNLYSGGTLLSSGTLKVTNTTGSATGSGPVAVNGGTLAGGGSISGGVNQSAGTISPGVPGTTLTMGSLNFSGGSLAFVLNGTGYNTSSASSQISTGSATFTAQPTISLSAINPTGLALTQVYPLLISATPINGSSFLTGLGTFDIGRFTVTASEQTAGALAGKEIIATVGGAGPANLIWAGGVSGLLGSKTGDTSTWDNTQIPGTSGNWNNAGYADYFYDLDNVTFNDTGTPNYNVNISGTVSPGSVTVNTTNTYTFQGGSIAGAGSLNVAGGTLNLNNGANSYSGGTIIGSASGPSATLQTGNSNQLLGTGTVTVNATGTLDLYGNSQTIGGLAGAGTVNTSGGAATLTVMPSGSTTFNGVINNGNGQVGLTIAGTGTEILTGSNTYSGATTINAGATLQIGNNTPIFSLSSSSSLTDNGTLVFNLSTGAAIPLSNLITGTGGVTLSGSAANVFQMGSNNYSGGTTITAGQIQLTDANGIGTGDLTVASGASLDLNSLSPTIGAINGAGSIDSSTGGTGGGATAITLTVGNNNDSGTFTGTVNNSNGIINLVKNGSGTQTIGLNASGAAYYTGGTTVNEGTLVLGGVTNISAGTIGLTGLGGGAANLIIADSAQVTSTAILYLEDATLAQGYPASTNLTVKGNSKLTVAGLSIGLNPGTRVASSSVTVQDTATLTVNGDYDLNNTAGSTASNSPLYLNGGTLAVNDFTLTSISGNGTAVIHLNGGVLEALQSNSAFLPALPKTTINVDSGGALINTNGYNITIAGGLTHGTGTPDGGLIKSGAGTLTLTGANSYTGTTNVSAGTLVVSSVTAFPSGTANAGTGLIVASGATFQIANQSSNASWVPFVSSLADSGTIDLTDNAMVIRNANTSIGTLFNEVKAGYHGGAWNGTGSGVILSSAAAGDLTHLSAVGIATNLSSFEGAGGTVTVGTSDVVLKDTYYGDANLDGQVNSTDYTLIDAGYLSGGTKTGWQNGDFNYDGVINGSDYTLIDNAFNTQGAQLSAEIATNTAQIAGGAGTASAVPEPTSLGLLGLGAMGLLGRRNRRRK
jgi:autotransporter-associated beta strand protein